MDPRSNGVVLWELMLVDVKAGRKAAPRKRYQQTNPELFVAGAKPVDTSQGLFRAKDVALSLIALPAEFETVTQYVALVLSAGVV